MNDINLLNSSLQILCREFLAQCAAQGLDAHVTETFRSPEREDQLHAQGITPATSANCKHCCTNEDGTASSKAFDFALFDNTGAYIKDGSDHRYYQAGQIGKQIGLIWGGDFHHPDPDHMEIT